MKRRDFLATLALSSIATKELFAAKLPMVGCQTSLENAAAVQAAGGNFIGLSVAGWLEPGGEESVFLERLKQAAESPVPVIICNSFIRPKNLHATGPEANHDALLNYAETAFVRAQRAGIKMINFGSGNSRNLPEGFSQEEGMQQFIALLKRMGPLAAKYGVTVGVEQLRIQECNFITRISEVERVVRGANHKNIRGVADFYHMATMGDTPEQLASAADLIMHVEMAEVKDRRMIGTSGEDFRPYMKVLKKAKYKGALSVEGRFEVSELKNGFAEILKQWKEA